MKHSIALKIFALAVGILCLMVIVGIITNIAVVGLGDEMSLVATKVIPIARIASDLNEDGLRRRIAFERLKGELEVRDPDAKVIQESNRDFDIFTGKVHQYVNELELHLKDLPADHRIGDLFARTRELLGQIRTSFKFQTEIATRILQMYRAGDATKAAELVAVNIQMQNSLQDQRSQLQDLAMEMANLASIEAKENQKLVLWSSVVTTVLAIFLGLAVAWIISRNMTRPLMDLTRTTKAVAMGDLSVTLSRFSDDEVGQLCSSVNAMVEGLRKKQEMQKAISTYIDQRIVEKIILSGRPEDMAGQRRVMTVLFADMVGFTSLGEQLTPSGLVRVLNRYFSLLSEAIAAENGIVDKFIGDAVMAYWGPPFVAEDEQAFAACRAALLLLDALKQFQEELPELMGLRKNVPVIHLRVGLATGEVVVGNIGSETTRSYTVIGDVVNLASRLEAANTTYGTGILISEETRRMVERIVETKEIDLIAVKGKTESVRIHELLSLSGGLSVIEEQKRQQFSRALQSYREQQWTEAEALFTALVTRYSDPVSVVFLERIAELKQLPPREQWDAVWRMNTK